MDQVEDTMSSLDEFFHYTQSPPPSTTTLTEVAEWQQSKPNRSTSSSSNDSDALPWTESITTDSTVSTSPPLSMQRTEMQFTWLPANASSLSTARRHSNSKMSARKQRASVASTTTTSSPPEIVDDGHAEESCAKCRLTEVEARKLKVERRREQNRASQRKFRARKEAKIRDAASQVSTLETYVEFLERHNNDLEQINAKLTSKIAQLQDQTGRSGLVNPKAVSSLFSVIGRGASTMNKKHIGPASKGAYPVPWGPSDPQARLYLSLFDHDLQPNYPFARTLPTLT